MSYRNYGDRGRAERTPGSHDFVVMAGLLVAAAVAAGTLVGAGLLDGLVLSGRAPSLAHRRLAGVVSEVVTHPGRPLTAFRVDRPGDAWVYWSTVAVLAGLAATVAWRVWTWVSRWGAKTHDGFATDATLRRTLSARAARAKRAQTRPDLAGRRQRGGHRVRLPAGPGGHLRSPPALGVVGVVDVGHRPARVRKNVPAAGPGLAGPSRPGHRHLDQGRHLRGHRQSPPGQRKDRCRCSTPKTWRPPAGRCAGRWCAAARTPAPPSGERRPWSPAPRAARPLDTGNSAFFKTSALSVLKAFLHAAALGDKTIVDVTRWCRGDHAEAQAILAGQADAMVDPARMLTQHTIGAPETTCGVMRYVENTLACFAHRPVIDLCTPSPDDDFDMEPFRGRGRHRLPVGPGREGVLGVGADHRLLRGAVVCGRRRDRPRPGRAGGSPRPCWPAWTRPLRWRPSRPCPCSWPTPEVGGSWSSCRAQSPSQLRTKWSDDETDTMFNASTIQTVFGGLSVDRDLRWMSELAGQRFVMDHTRQVRPGLAQPSLHPVGPDPGAAPRRDPHLAARSRPGHGGRQPSGDKRPATRLRQPRRPPSGRGDGRDRHSQRPSPHRPGHPGPGPMSDLARRGTPETARLAVRQLMQPAWTGPAREMPPAGSMADPDYQPGGVWPWDWTAIDARQARRMWTRLRGLVEFLNQRYAWDHTQLIPPCWAFHGGLVEELTTLYWSRWAAFSGPDASADRAQNWHTYHLPAFYQRMHMWCGGPHNLTQCQSGQHQPPRRPTNPDRVAEWAEATADVAQLDQDLRPVETLGYADLAALAGKAAPDDQAGDDEGGDDEGGGEFDELEEEQTQGGAMASLEKLRTDRETDAREQLDSWADELRAERPGRTRPASKAARTP